MARKSILMLGGSRQQVIAIQRSKALGVPHGAVRLFAR